jgi:carbonic anhydrase/acetyltransferase-like protein (isoleucine patch superfamily)
MPKSLPRRIANRILGLLARQLPGARTLRPALHRLRGMKVGRRVWIGDDVYLENEYPELITLEDGAQICLRTIVLAHTHGPGQVVLGRDCFIGTGSLISATTGRTVRIGEGAVVSAYSVISSDVPAQAFIAPPKPTILARATLPLTDDVPFERFIRGLKPWRK